MSEDIDPDNLDAVMWSIAYRCNPVEDVHIPPYHGGVQGSQYSGRGLGSKLLIDATMKGPMAPLALPKKEFMERAQALWEKLGLPPITLKQPWHGYELGDWIERWDTWAARAVSGTVGGDRPRDAGAPEDGTQAGDAGAQGPGLMGWFGASVQRKEDPALLTGRGRFVDDIALPGMLHAVVLRSPHGHAGIRGIDKSAALAMPGVHAVFTYADLPESMQRQTVPLLVPSPTIKQVFMPYCLAKDEVCFVGEPVAIVVADSRYLAEDAAAQVEVDYEVLPAVSDPAKGLAPGAPLAHRGLAQQPRRLHPGQGRRHRRWPSRRRRMCSARRSSSIAAGRSSWNAAA